MIAQIQGVVHPSPGGAVFGRDVGPEQIQQRLRPADVLHQDHLTTHVAAERIRRFHFRAMRPTFDTSDFLVFGAPGDDTGHFKLWSTDNDGARAVEAEAWAS